MNRTSLAVQFFAVLSVVISALAAQAQACDRVSANPTTRGASACEGHPTPSNADREAIARLAGQVHARGKAQIGDATPAGKDTVHFGQAQAQRVRVPVRARN